MKIVIDIPEEDYDELVRSGDKTINLGLYLDLGKAVKNGTPLPEGAEILTKEAYSDLCTRAAEQPEKRTEERTESHACDCISREAAYDEIIWNSDNGVIDAKVAIEALRKLPSVEPERNPGKWEYVQYDGNPKIGNWHCSECRLIVNFGFEGTPYYHYCPGCGVKMEVDE